MKWEVRVRPHSSYPWPGRASIKWKCGSSECKNSSPQMTDSTVQLYKILGSYSQCINTWCEQSEWHNWIAGDGLHILFICQLPLKRTLPAWHKIKQAKTWPLKEGFRQVPAKRWQDFQTTWRIGWLPRWYANHKQKQSKVQMNLKQLRYLCKQLNKSVQYSDKQTTVNNKQTIPMYKV